MSTKKARFLISCAKPEQFPLLELKEVAFVGRSNVGKSSLLNHFTESNGLAHVSSKPGKTQLINFFDYQGKWTLVDLPGYGYAKVPKHLQSKWGDLIQEYLEKRKNLSLILLLVDLRHPPTKEDLAFAKWASHFHKPFLIVFTKADKLTPNQQKQHLEKNFALMKEAIGDTPISSISYTIKSGKARIALTKALENALIE